MTQGQLAVSSSSSMAQGEAVTFLSTMLQQGCTVLRLAVHAVVVGWDEHCCMRHAVAALFAALVIIGHCHAGDVGHE